METAVYISLYSSAFSGCTGLVTVSLAEGVAKIGERCFEDCTSLEKLVLPTTLQSIGTYVFNNCSVLKTLWYRGSSSQWNNVSKATDWLKANNSLTGVTKYNVG
jgi:hypothetical protein